MNVGLKGAEPLPPAARKLETRDVDLHAIDARALGAARSAGD